MADNVESFANLQENLIENHLSLVQIPYVLQYNKRDIPERRADQLPRIHLQ